MKIDKSPCLSGDLSQIISGSNYCGRILTRILPNTAGRNRTRLVCVNSFAPIGLEVGQAICIKDWYRTACHICDDAAGFCEIVHQAILIVTMLAMRGVQVR